MEWGLTLAGFEHAWFCESDPYCRRVLALRYPGIPVYGDVRTLLPDAGRDEHEGAAHEDGGPSSEGLPEPARVDILAGGFPCQPFSYAGERRGLSDERWLWAYFARAVRELRPRYVVVENVPGLAARGGGMGRVVGDLAELGYDAEWDRVFAASFGAPHLRERLFLVAYPDGQGELQQGGAVGEERRWALDGGEPLAHANGVGRQEGLQQRSGRRERPGTGHTEWGGQYVQDPDGGSVLARRLRWRAPQTGSAGWWAAEPDVGRVAHGVPDRLDRLAALGNGVVPQIARWIGERIAEREELT